MHIQRNTSRCTVNFHPLTKKPCNPQTFCCVIPSLQDIISLEAFEVEGSSLLEGEVLYQMGLEVRSLCHPRFLRALYNRHNQAYDVYQNDDMLPANFVDPNR